MSKAQSLANKKRWSLVSPEKRSQIMRAKATSKWSKTTKKQRLEHSRHMLAHRDAKRSTATSSN